MSSSKEAPQPITLDRSLPVPSGRMPTWHCSGVWWDVVCGRMVCVVG